MFNVKSKPFVSEWRFPFEVPLHSVYSRQIVREDCLIPASIVIVLLQASVPVCATPGLIAEAQAATSLPRGDQLANPPLLFQNPVSVPPKLKTIAELTEFWNCLMTINCTILHQCSKGSSQTVWNQNIQFRISQSLIPVHCFSFFSEFRWFHIAFW